MNVIFQATVAVLLTSVVAKAESLSGVQWQITEIKLTAAQQQLDPFDPDQRLIATFNGPKGESLKIVGFWDGGNDWKIRFTPTSPGKWRMATEFEGNADEGLRGQRAEILVSIPEAKVGVGAHGGFLKPSSNNRYLTYTDGRPFFWLGDTWWEFPGENISLDLFKKMVDKRVSQGFTTYQYHGLRFSGSAGIDAFKAISVDEPNAVAYWQALDPFIDYSAEKGLVGVVGFGIHKNNDKISLQQLKRLWSYYLARYGAYPLSMLMTQEYNDAAGDQEGRIEKFKQLGQYVSSIDPYQRAMGAHPTTVFLDRGEVWGEAWCSIRMLQGGHFVHPHEKTYYERYFKADHRPLIQAEQNYEGFSRGEFHCDPATVRTSAYFAIQCGAAGYTYGAQGLYSGITDVAKPETTEHWGPVITIDDALKMPGADQMHFMARFYRNLPWYEMEPIRDSPIPGGHGIVTGSRKGVHAVYVKAGMDLTGIKSPYLTDGTYRVRLFDPRRGEFHEPQKAAGATTRSNCPTRRMTTIGCS